MIVETAPAKINLFLHIGPVRADGLHALASLFVFTEDGDRISVAPADELSLTLEGPFAAPLRETPAADNLVMKAAELLRAEAGVSNGAAITLDKRLPIASGIGGGSADAAAALRALLRLWEISMPADALHALAFRLGADVPACLSRAPVMVTGAGETINAGPELPPLYVCLVNPRIDMPTGPVFRAFDAENPAPPAPGAPAGDWSNEEKVAAMMAVSRNDLEPPAAAQAPVIADVLAALRAAPGVVAARMSGSGATSFGLFATEAAARDAARAAESRGWWALASRLALR